MHYVLSPSPSHVFQALKSLSNCFPSRPNDNCNNNNDNCNNNNDNCNNNNNNKITGFFLLLLVFAMQVSFKNQDNNTCFYTEKRGEKTKF